MSKKLSKLFLQKQKSIIENEQKKILKQIDVLKEEDPFSDPDHASDNAAVDTDVREQVGHETVEAQIKDLNRRLSDLKIVIQRFGKGYYGVCERCGEDIPEPRLKLVPEARFCIECERKLRK